LFQGKFIKFRPLEDSDLKKLRDWRNSNHVKRTTREYRLLNMFNQKSWFESIHKQNPPQDIMFGIINKKKSLIGVCGLTYIDWKNRHAEISIYLDGKNWQKKKETFDAIIVLCKYGFDEIGLHKLYVEIYSFVDETIDLYKLLNFKRDGILRDTIWRNGKWWNSYIFSKLENEFKNE